MAWWVDHAYSAEWLNSASRLHSFIPDAKPRLLELALPRPVWTNLTTFEPVLCTSAHPCTNGEWSLQRSVSVAWRIKLQTMLYKDANIRHQMVSMVCRSWMMMLSNGSRPYIPISILNGFGLKGDNFKL